MLYLTTGSLPWENFKGKDTLENLRFVTEKKETTKIESLTRGLPSKRTHVTITYSRVSPVLQLLQEAGVHTGAGLRLLA